MGRDLPDASLRKHAKVSKLIKCPAKKRERFRLSAKLPVDVIEGFITPFTRLVNTVRGTKSLEKSGAGIHWRHAKMENGRPVALCRVHSAVLPISDNPIYELI